MTRYFDSATQKLASKVLRVAERLVRNSFVHKMSRKKWNKYCKQIYIPLEDNKHCLRMLQKKKAFGMIAEEFDLKKIEKYASHFGEWVKEYRILINEDALLRIRTLEGEYMFRKNLLFAYIHELIHMIDMVRCKKRILSEERITQIAKKIAESNLATYWLDNSIRKDMEKTREERK